MAGWVTIAGSVLVVLSVFAQISTLGSLDTRRTYEQLLSEPPGDGLGISVETMLQVVRVLAMVTGACAAATAILGWQVMQRSRSARLALTILAVPLFLAGFVTGGFTTSLVAAACVVLWLQPARAWVDGDPVPERYLRPVERSTATSGPAPGTGWPPPPPPAEASSDPSSESPAEAPRTGPSAYQGFGTAAAATSPVGGPVHQAPSAPVPRGSAPQQLRAALVLTWVGCAMVVVGLALSVVAIALDPALVDTEIQRALDENPTMADQVSVDQMRVVLLAMLGGLAAWAVAAAVLALLAWLGRSWAWVLLCVSAAASAGLFFLVTVVGGFVAAIPLALTAGSLALLLRPEVRAWYAARR